MNAAASIDSLKTHWTEEEYLTDTGLDPNVRYEYVQGKVYPTTTPDRSHAEISANFFVPLRQFLRGKLCRTFMREMALRINLPGLRAFYIPDVMVACDDKPSSSNYCEEPVVLMEIMSPSTASIDQREKLVAYTALPSLRHYLIVNSLKMEVFHYSRNDRGWADVILNAPQDIIRIPELEFSLTVGQLYEQSGV